jgi:hypothetical protein
MCTIHADSSAAVFRRIASYAVQAQERLPLEASNLLIAGAVHFVVHLDSELQDDMVPAPGSPLASGWPILEDWGDPDQRHHFPAVTSRQRFVSSVREIVDAEGVQVISNEVFRPGADRRATVASPFRPDTLRELERFGYEAFASDYIGSPA